MTNNCPLCHTSDLVSVDALPAAWQCRRCGQHWDPVRLATAAAYTAWAASGTLPAAEALHTIQVGR